MDRARFKLLLKPAAARGCASGIDGVPTWGGTTRAGDAAGRRGSTARPGAPVGPRAGRPMACRGAQPRGGRSDRSEFRRAVPGRAPQGSRAVRR